MNIKEISLKLVRIHQSLMAGFAQHISRQDFKLKAFYGNSHITRWFNKHDTQVTDG